MPSNSTSNTNVEFAGIGPCDLFPYPNSGGMISFLFPPMRIVETPKSQPLITSPTPIWKEKGTPRSFELSNLTPLVNVPV